MFYLIVKLMGDTYNFDDWEDIYGQSTDRNLSEEELIDYISYY